MVSAQSDQSTRPGADASAQADGSEGGQGQPQSPVTHGDSQKGTPGWLAWAGPEGASSSRWGAPQPRRSGPVHPGSKRLTAL